MYRASLILIAALVLCTIGLPNASAADAGDGSMDTLSAYLHGHRMPLVEARMITNERGERSLLLYGYVATPYGKSDAEDQARDFLDDPDVTIVNRIKVKPELLTLGTATDNSNAGTEAQPDASATQGDLEGDTDQTAAQTEDFPDVIGDREDYANQEQNDEMLTGNGALIGGLPLAMVILGSGSIFPPVLPYPIYYNRLPSSFASPPIVVPSPPIFVVRHSFGPQPFRGFPTGVSPFPAGPAPMFPATGGAPPFVNTITPGFGGFARPGFVHGGFGGGFGGGFHGGGFGGRR